MEERICDRFRAGQREDSSLSHQLPCLWLPRTGNILVTDGGKYTDADGHPVASPGKLRWARVVEVTHTTPAEKIFELHITSEPPMGFHVYRADRIPTLFPE